MGTKIRKINIVIDSNGYHVRPGKLDITKAKILAYVKDFPMTEDSEYSLDDLVMDLAESSNIYGIYTLPINIKEETMRYIETLIDKLKDGRNYDIWKI